MKARLPRKVILIFLLLHALIHVGIHAQSKTIFITKGCNMAKDAGGDAPGNVDVYEPTAEAIEIVQAILSDLSITNRKDLFDLYSSNKVANARAGIEPDNRRSIIYNLKFIERIKADAQTKRVVYVVFAHEIAHHFLQQDLGTKDHAKRRQMELAADAWAARRMARMNVPLDDVMAAMDAPEINLVSEDYPDLDTRKESMNDAYTDELTKIKSAPPMVKSDLKLDPAAYNKFNLITTAEAKYDDEKVEIQYILSSAFLDKKLQVVLCCSDPRIKTKIKSTKGTGREYFVMGPKKVIWNFKADGVKRVDIPQGALRLYVFDENKIPNPQARVSTGVKLSTAVFTGAGIGLMGYGMYLWKDGKDIYKIYEKVTDPGDPVFADESRAARYARADKKYFTGQVLMLAGGILTTTGIIWNSKKKALARKERAAGCAANSPLPWHTILPCINENGLGLAVRF